MSYHLVITNPIIVAMTFSFSNQLLGNLENTLKYSSVKAPKGFTRGTIFSNFKFLCAVKFFLNLGSFVGNQWHYPPLV